MSTRAHELLVTLVEAMRRVRPEDAHCWQCDDEACDGIELDGNDELALDEALTEAEIYLALSGATRT
jgi:hypothetical protein